MSTEMDAVVAKNPNFELYPGETRATCKHSLELLGTAQRGVYMPREMKYLVLWFHKIFNLEMFLVL